MTIIPLEKQRAIKPLLPLSSQQVVHLPIAPQVTARTRFASSDPIKTEFMQPREAITWLEDTIQERSEEVKMVAITGPGDPLAVPDTTFQTLELVKERYPDMKLGLRSLGIGGERFAKEIAQAGVSYMEIDVQAVQPEVLEKLYAWVRPGQKTLTIKEGTALLVKEQLYCIPALKFHGIDIVVSTTLFPGYNLDQVPLIARKMKEVGANGISLVPYTPESGAEVQLPPPDCKNMEKAFEEAEKHLPLFKPLLETQKAQAKEAVSHLPQATGKRTNVAVVSSNGMDIDLHLGHARQVLIYGPRKDGLHCLLETRPTPAAGTGEKRWHQLSSELDDCFALLAANAGSTPKEVLSSTGLPVIITDDNVEGSVDVLFTGGKKKRGKGKFQNK